MDRMVFAKKRPVRRKHDAINSIPSLWGPYVVEQFRKVNALIPVEVAEEVIKTGSVQKLNEVLEACEKIDKYSMYPYGAGAEWLMNSLGEEEIKEGDWVENGAI